MDYHWNAVNNYWAKAVLADGFSLETLCSQPWAAAPNLTIDVFTDDGSRVARRRTGPQPQQRRAKASDGEC